MPRMRHAYVTTEGDNASRALPGGTGEVRVTIDRAAGCQNLVQRVCRFGPGRSAKVRHDVSEEVLYVARGRGAALVDGRSHALAPGTGLLVPPGSTFAIDNPGPAELTLVSILSPQPGRPPGQQADAELRADGKLTASEDEEQAVSAGDDRVCRLLIDPRYGCRNLTQFDGAISPGRSPDHTHTYEEVIYILEGEGIVHAGGEGYRIEASSCIYLPPGTPHCLENTGTGPLRLLGVFCPAGSPAAKLEAR